MDRNHIRALSVPGEPVLHAPPGAEPRSLKSDAFFQNAPFPSPVAPKPEPIASTSAVRDWDFALPAPLPPRAADPLLDPDANWRRQAGLRAPVETSAFPDITRERFSENWERLAAEPRRERHRAARHRVRHSLLCRWLFTGGRFDITAAAGPLLLLALLAAVILGTRKLLGGTGAKPGSAAERNAASSAP